MKEKKEVTKKEIRNLTGKCAYCWKKDVDWFCVECWWGICDDCLDDGTWDDTCQDCLLKANIPLLGDINLFED